MQAQVDAADSVVMAEELEVVGVDEVVEVEELLSLWVVLALVEVSVSTAVHELPVLSPLSS